MKKDLKTNKKILFIQDYHYYYYFKQERRIIWDLNEENRNINMILLTIVWNKEDLFSDDNVDEDLNNLFILTFLSKWADIWLKYFAHSVAVNVYRLGLRYDVGISYFIFVSLNVVK